MKVETNLSSNSALLEKFGLLVKSKFVLIFIIMAFILSIACVLETQTVNVSSAIATANHLKIDTGDTAWIMISTALVLLMTPGLAMFYGGMVRSKNVLGTIMQSFIALGICTAVWVLYGYSLAFGSDKFGIIGDLSWIGLKGVGLTPNPDYAATIPHQAFMLFQMMFAVITPALITGAFAERFKFKAYVVFLVLWLTLVYCPIAHWVWGIGGWMRNLGILDFAGGLVVHISSGAAALASILIVGKRMGYLSEPMPPHNLVLTIIGTGLLWFGWFGFNGGSAVSSGTMAVSAIVVSHIASAFAAISWCLAEWIHLRKTTVLGAASGAIAGLATITPAAGFVSPTAAVAIGFIAGILCYAAVTLKTKLKYDDSLDVIGVHGVGSTWGMIATGLFASTAVNALGNNGLLHGNPKFLLLELFGIVVIWVYSFVVTCIILKAIEAIIGLRVTEEDEFTGLDLSQHGERGYTF